MSNPLVDRAHDLLRSGGIDIVRFRPQGHWLARRRSLMRSYGVDLVVDVGASDGEYAASLRRLGYNGDIVSFEPLPDAAARLRARHGRDARWRSFEIALGDAPGDAELHVAGNSSSSSFLPMLSSHERHAPESAFVGSIRVQVRTLDELADEVIGNARRPLLKIDTQGYEKRVLDGARDSIRRFVGVQVELSIEPLYAGAPDYLDMLRILADNGFGLASVEPGFSDRRSGRLLQFDALVFRPLDGP
jgi:FkbM family methyltransferase